MPQMAPMNWLLLFMYFTMMLIMMNPINYFSFKYKQKLENLLKTKFNLNWKW